MLLTEPAFAGGLAVGAVGALVVPHEDGGGDYDDGEDLDVGSQMPVVIKRPDREEWVTLFADMAIKARLHRRQKEGRDFEQDYYYVAPELRGPVAGDIKPFRVVPYYSWLKKRLYLLVTAASEPGASSWTDSLAVLLQKPKDWHAARAVRIISNKEAARYDARSKPAPGEAPRPTSDTGALLGTALGTGGFIVSRDHAVYQSMIEGEVLS